MNNMQGSDTKPCLGVDLVDCQAPGGSKILASAQDGAWHDLLS